MAAHARRIEVAPEDRPVLEKWANAQTVERRWLIGPGSCSAIADFFRTEIARITGDAEPWVW